INEAVFHFQEALRINPEFELAQDNLKRALAIQQQQMDTETAKIQTALKANPDDPQLNYKLGNLYLGKGQFDKAIAQFRKTLSIRPNFSPALNSLAMALTFSRQYDQARAVFQQLLELQPDNASNYYNVAVLYALQNRQAEALEWLNTAVAKGYDNWDLIKSDKDLESIRNSEGYKNLVEGH
ncbi:MAG: tetratricopeptide repeat protein, partial [Desulfobacterales bacterium]